VSFSGSGNYPVTAAKRGLRRAVTGSPPISKRLHICFVLCPRFQTDQKKKAMDGVELNIDFFVCTFDAHASDSDDSYYCRLDFGKGGSVRARSLDLTAS
jgi:hypothetical protein